MTVIQCDNCNKTILKGEHRLIGTIQRLSDNDNTFVKDLVTEYMDFCSVDCLCSFIKRKLEDDKELV